jgi:hypothetical protein
MIKTLLKNIFDDVLSAIKAPIVLGIVAALSALYTYLKIYWQSVENAMQLQVPLWEPILVALFVLCLISIPALLIIRKNKSLKKELETANQVIKDLELKNNNNDPFIRAERKTRIQKWRDDANSCNRDLCKFYETSSYLELLPLLIKEESSRISHFNSQGNSITIIDGAVMEAIVPSDEMFKCYQQAINRIEKEWSLI